MAPRQLSQARPRVRTSPVKMFATSSPRLRILRLIASRPTPPADALIDLWTTLHDLQQRRPGLYALVVAFVDALTRRAPSAPDRAS
jgi:hypothetical protein